MEGIKKSKSNNKENNSKPQTWASFQLPSEQINYSHANTGDNHKPSVATANRTVRWKRPWLMSRNSIAEDESWKYSARQRQTSNGKLAKKVADDLSMSATSCRLGKGFRIYRKNSWTARKFLLLGAAEVYFRVLSLEDNTWGVQLDHEEVHFI